MKKIGIFGGSFDPVHFGHIYLALNARDEADLSEVVFVPTYIQPFKQDKKATEGFHRYNMLSTALEDEHHVSVSSYELDKNEISYSFDTLRHFRDVYGEETEIFFITGTDSFLKIEKWKNAEEILSNYSFLIGTRPGYREDELDVTIETVRKKYGCKVINIKNKQYDISSTEIRDRLNSGEPIGDLIPEKVERYIRENGLYQEM